MLTTSMASLKKGSNDHWNEVERGGNHADGGEHEAREHGLKHHALGAACDGDGTRHGGDIVIHNDYLSAFGSGGGCAVGQRATPISATASTGASFTPSPTIIVTVLPAPVAALTAATLSSGNSSA